MKTLFTFPQKAFLGRNIPKNRIYEHASPTKALKELFVREVDRITWSYKLSPETLNLPPRAGVREIQVFTVVLKHGSFKHEILQVIDKAIPSPIIFEIIFENLLCYAATYKRPSEADRAKWVISGCFQTEWFPQGNERKPLPVVLDLEALYHALLRQIIDLPERTAESIAELVERADRIMIMVREADQMALRLQRERQFNRKVEINSNLKILRSRIEELKQ